MVSLESFGHVTHTQTPNISIEKEHKNQVDLNSLRGLILPYLYMG